jgi:hypothetical protein
MAEDGTFGDAFVTIWNLWKIDYPLEPPGGLATNYYSKLNFEILTYPRE